jgi:hypothetical protein
MSFDWANYLRLAEDLAAKADEASLRTAISRAYYSIFNVAYERAEKNLGRKPASSGSHHKWCWDAYGNCNDSTCQELAVEGRRLKWLRVDVDYKSEQKRHLNFQCQRVLADVHAFSAKLSALDAALPR